MREEVTVIGKMIAKVSADEKFSVAGQSFDICGICKSCNRKGKTVASMTTTHERAQEHVLFTRDQK